MDAERFDRWTRQLVGVQTRRRAVRALAGAGLIGVAGYASPRDAAACLEDGQFCTNNEECCGVCISFNCTDCVPKNGHGCEGPHDCCGGKMDCEDGRCVKKKKKDSGCANRSFGVQAEGCKKKKKKH